MMGPKIIHRPQQQQAAADAALLPSESRPFAPQQQRRFLQQQQRPWEQIGNNIHGAAASDRFGRSVSLSADGTRLAVGAPVHDSSKGQVRVFDLTVSGTTNTWTQLGQDIDGDVAGDESGLSVSLSANDATRLVIGAHFNNNNKGRTRVYDWNEANSLWDSIANSIDGLSDGDESGVGVSVSADGNRVAVGEYRTDGINGTDSGSARVFTMDYPNWIRIGQVLYGEDASNSFGRSISLSSDGYMLAVGAPRNDGANGAASEMVGHVRVFNYTGPYWTQVGQDIDGKQINERSGFYVRLSADGTRLAVGAYWNNNANGVDSGAVRVYEYSSGLWNQLGQDIIGDAADDRFGWSVSMSASGGRVAIGAPKYGNAIGQVRVFDWDGTLLDWVQVGLQILGDVAGDEFGVSCSLSADGKRLAIGSQYYDDGTNKIDSGLVRVYDAPPYVDFDVAVDQLIVNNLTAVTDFSQAIVLQYSYTGVTPDDDDSVEFTFDIFRDDCSTTFAPAGTTDQSLNFTGFDLSVHDKVTAKIGMDLATIEQSDVWSHPGGDETEATLSFCGRWNINIDGVKKQFHDSLVTATILLTEDSGFDIGNATLDRGDTNVNNKNVGIEFPVNVTFCNGDAESIVAPVINQGTPVQLCIKLATPSTDDVYVQTIDSMSYTSTAVTGDPITLIDAGTLKVSATAEVDCGQKAGVCRVNFLPDANMFVDDANNKLDVVGRAVVAFGTDLSRLRRRQVANLPEDSGGSLRLLEYPTEEGQQLTPFSFTIENLQPSIQKQSPLLENRMFVLAAVGGFMLVALIAGSAAVFFKYRHRMMTDSTNEEEPTEAARTTYNLKQPRTPSDLSSSADPSRDQKNAGNNKHESVEA